MNKTFYQQSFDTLADLLSYLNDEDNYIIKTDIISIYYNNHLHCYELFYVK
jgi:hypothetical protein